jgi:ketosteroid isomerase-like protein
MRRYWESFQDVLEEIRFRHVRLIDTGRGVLVEMEWNARGRHTALPVEQRLAALWTISQGKVRHVQVYGSMEEAMAEHGITGAS